METIARSVTKTATSALLSASTKLQAYARQVELREPAVSTPFYGVSCWLKTAATVAGAL